MLNKIKFLVVATAITLTTIVKGAEKTGYLSVSVDDSMQIYVDTTYAGRFSFSNLELPVGEHTIHVYKAQKLDWGERGISKNIEIVENQHITLDFVLADQVKVLSLPVGAKVFAGDALIGHTPININRDLVGTKEIILEKNGYVDRSFKLVSNQKEYSFNLTPVQDDIQLKVASSMENQNTLKWYREGLIVTSLISSWTAFYYKRKADQAYTKYQVTSDSKSRSALWNDTRQYDTFAEIAIGVSVATLGTYIYLLLTD